jgi:hypothetical protein
MTFEPKIRTMTSLEKAVSEIKRRALEAGDRESTLWTFLNGRPSPMLRGSRGFGPDQDRIEVIDVFGGREPIAVNYNFINGGTNQVAFQPMVLLDSNVVAYMQEFVNSTSQANPGRRRAVLELLDWLNTVNWDYNALFYFMESAAKDERGAFYPHAVRATRDMLILHTMNVEVFQQSGRVLVDPFLLRPYQEDYQEREIDGIAKKQVDRMLSDGHEWLKALEPMHAITYAVLMKMALLNRRKGLSLLDKDECLRSYIDERIGISLGRELCLASFYFAGQVGRFVKFEKSMGMEKIRRSLMASAWDLFLLRLPEYLLARIGIPATVVAYPCTTEKALQIVGRSTHIEMISAPAGSEAHAIPILSFHPRDLEPVIGTEALETLEARGRAATLAAEKRALRGEPASPKIDPAQLVAEVENEARKELSL